MAQGLRTAKVVTYDTGVRSSKARRPASKRKMMRVLWGRKCWMCGGEAKTVDHFVPRSRGGDDTVYNRQPACSSCNNWKGSRSPTTVIELMKNGEGPPRFMKLKQGRRAVLLEGLSTRLSKPYHEEPKLI